MTPAGIVVALVAIVMSMILDHGKPAALVNIPAMLLVFGGTIGVTVAGSTGRDAKSLPKLVKTALKPPKLPDARSTIDSLVALAREARRSGLVEMEKMAKDSGDPFLSQGIELIASSSDPEQVRELLGAEIEGMQARHKRGAKLFSDMGGFGPTLGILGTVIGLVHVLGNLSKPSTLGPAIATAFIATLWGVLSANVFWIPIGNRLRRLSEAETEYRNLIVEGLLSIQAGQSTNAVRDRLASYLAPGERGGLDSGEAAPAKAEEAA